MPSVRFRRLARVPLPFRATPGSAGLDLHAAERVIVKARSWATVRTGIALQLPGEIEAQVRPRSGLAAKHGIGILNSPGTVDADYRGEIKVVLFNLSGKDLVVEPKDRIAQLVFSQPVRVTLVESRRLNRTTRGKGGFGHTGRSGQRHR